MKRQVSNLESINDDYQKYKSYPSGFVVFVLYMS